MPRTNTHNDMHLLFLPIPILYIHTNTDTRYRVGISDHTENRRNTISNLPLPIYSKSDVVHNLALDYILLGRTEEQ